MAHKVLHCSTAPSLAIVMLKVLVVPQTCYSLPQKSVFKPLSARNILYPLRCLVKSHSSRLSSELPSGRLLYQLGYFQLQLTEYQTRYLL